MIWTLEAHCGIMLMGKRWYISSIHAQSLHDSPSNHQIFIYIFQFQNTTLILEEDMNESSMALDIVGVCIKSLFLKAYTWHKQGPMRV